MTAEPERFHYVLDWRGGPSETFLGSLWPAPDLIVAHLRVWRLVTASVLSDSDMRIVRRAGRRVPIRTARYRELGVSPGPPCGHSLAFGAQCTVCTPILCADCPHPAHLGSCQSTLTAWVDRWTEEERARANCPCDTHIGQVRP